MSDYINISVENRVQFIRINRPDKKNALNLDMYTSMANAINNANEDKEIRVSVITGTEDVFCSGNDIGDFLKNPPADDSSPVLRFVSAIIHAEKPLLAAVNGMAIGIGTTMLLHCDLVYAVDHAQFQMPFVNIGLCPEAGSTFLLPALMGHQRVSELLLLGDMFTADKACEIGIVNKVVNGNDLENVVSQAALRIAQQPPAAVRTTKTLLRNAFQSDVVAASQRENDSFIPMLHGGEAKEALSAFMEKRKPDFSAF